MKNIINCGHNVTVSMIRVEDEPAFVVNIPKLGCNVYGGWNWGPHNPKEPGLIETLIGAKEVLIGSFNEYIYDFNKDNERIDAIREIDYALSYILGKKEVSQNRVFSKKCSFRLNEKTYRCVHKVKWRELSGWNDQGINVENSFEWYEEENSSKDRGTLKHVFEFDIMKIEQWEEIVNGRSSKELAIDIVSKYA